MTVVWRWLVVPSLSLLAACAGFSAVERDGAVDGAGADTAPADLGAEAGGGDTGADAGCGDGVTRRAHRTVAGVVKEDCAGCDCTDWKVYECFFPQDDLHDGEAWADLVWQVGHDVLRFAVTPTAKVFAVSHGPDFKLLSIKATVHALSPGESCDVDIEIDVEATGPDGWGGEATWLLSGRAVGAGYF